jgi:hypothetical protein
MPPPARLLAFSFNLSFRLPTTRLATTAALLFPFAREEVLIAVELQPSGVRSLVEGRNWSRISLPTLYSRLCLSH